jgi:hypothetical protein
MDQYLNHIQKILYHLVVRNAVPTSSQEVTVASNFASGDALHYLLL